MRILRQEDIALLFMVELAASYGGSPVPAAAVARNHGLSPIMLRKIAGMLRSAGLVDSREGFSGGYMLRKDPREITLLSVTDVITRNVQSARRSKLRSERCPLIPDCLPQTVNRYVTGAIERTLSNITLSDILSGRHS